MTSLAQYRRAIDRIDTQILSLLVERIHLAREVGIYKAHHHLSAEDPEREQAILERLAEKEDDPLTRDSIREVFSAIFHAAKKFQGKQQRPDQR